MARIEIEVTGQERGVDQMFSGIRRDVQRVDQALEQAGDAGREATQEIRRGAGQASTALDETAESADGVAESVENAGESGGALENMMGNLGGRAGALGDKLGELGPIGMAAAAALGVAMASVGLAVKGALAAVEASMERTNALAKAKAQLGLTDQEAAQFGRTAGKIYAQNYGESIEEAGDAVRDAVRVLGSTTSPELEKTAKNISNLASITGRETSQIGFAIKQMLVTGMAKNVDEAFDLLFAAINGGVDGMDDLIDSMGEYNALMQQSGLSAQEMFGLFKQGMDAGAFGTDKIADALKEFRLKVTGGGAAIDAAFKSLGINAEKATKNIAKGGEAGAKQLDEVLDKIRALQKVDPTGAAQAIQALFGGPGEDLGQSFFALDPSEAIKALGDIEGAADKANKTLGGSGFNAIESYRRQWEMFKADIGDKLAPTFERINEILQNVGKALTPLFNAGVKEIAQLWADNQDSIESFWEVAEPILELFGGALLGTIIMAIEMVISYIGLIGAAWAKVKDIFISVTPAILDFFGTILAAAARAFGWIPGLGPKLQQAQQDFADFAADVNRKLDSIDDEEVVVTAKLRDLTGGVATSGKATLKMRASGGYSSGLTTINERGPEIIDLGARGAYIHNNADTRAMLAGRGGDGTTAVSLSLAAAPGAANAVGALVTDLIRRKVIQLYVGTTPVTVGI